MNILSNYSDCNGDKQALDSYQQAPGNYRICTSLQYQLVQIGWTSLTSLCLACVSSVCQSTPVPVHSRAERCWTLQPRSSGLQGSRWRGTRRCRRAWGATTKRAWCCACSAAGRARPHARRRAMSWPACAGYPANEQLGLPATAPMAEPGVLKRECYGLVCVKPHGMLGLRRHK